MDLLTDTTSAYRYIFNDVTSLCKFLSIPLEFVFSQRRVDSAYSEFCIRSKSGKERIIDAPNEELKSAQRKLAEIFLDIYHRRACVHAFVKDRSIVSNARAHLGARHLIQLDLKNFFPSISFHRVKKLFEGKPFGFSREVSIALARLCCYQNRLPQGAPTSPIISNMICYRMDAQLQELASATGCAYTRYADDITFSTKLHNVDERILKKTSPVVVSDELIDTIENKNYFKINYDKIHFASGHGRKLVTGIKVNTKVNVLRTTYREVRSLIHLLRRFGYTKASEIYAEKNQKEYPFNIYKIINGKIAFISMVRGKNDFLVLKLKQQLKMAAIEFRITCLNRNIMKGYSIDHKEYVWFLQNFHLLKKSISSKNAQNLDKIFQHILRYVKSESI